MTTPLRPLHGRRIVNTRALRQAADLDALLVARGAEALSYPCIAIAAPSSTADLDDGLRTLTGGGFDWLALTSVNSVHALADRIDELGLQIGSHPPFRTAAVGAATAEVARAALGLEVAFVPTRHRAASLASELPLADGGRVLFPASDLAPSSFADALAARGGRVRQVVAYRNVMGTGEVDLVANLRLRQVDAILLASASAVDGLLARISTEGGTSADLRRVPILCIGPATRETALARGLDRATGAAVQTLAGLVDALEATLSPIASGAFTW